MKTMERAALAGAVGTWLACWATDACDTLQSAAAFTAGVLLSTALKGVYVRARLRYWLWSQKSAPGVPREKTSVPLPPPDFD
jgi:zinc transporter ZupT